MAGKRPIGIDLFAGAGGLSLGFEQAGFDIIASVDVDPIHCAVHAFNFPNCKTICKSIVDITGKELRSQTGIGKQDIDVVIGGAPCQGFSLIGKRAFDDPRNQLIYHFVRIVAELKPRYFVFENVKGLTVGRHKTFLDEVIKAFQSHGYKVVTEYKVLNAADYGVPQDRKRLFLMGARKDMALPVYPEPTDRVTVGEAIGDIPNAETIPELWDKDWAKVRFGKPSRYAAILRGILNDRDNYGYSRNYDRSILTSSLLTEHSKLSRFRFRKTRPNDVEPVSRYKKLHLDGICNTLRAGTASDRGAFTSPRPIHPIFPRVITVREAARLHSYPDWFRFHSTKWHGFRQIGNSVPPLLARAVGQEIMRALGQKPRKPIKPIDTAEEALLTLTMASASNLFGVSGNVIAKRLRPNIRDDEKNNGEAIAA